MKRIRSLQFLRILLRRFASGSGNGGVGPRDGAVKISPSSSAFTTISQRKPVVLEAEGLPDIRSVPLSTPLPGIAKTRYAVFPKSDLFKTVITTLDSGLKVASEPKFGEFCTVGVSIDLGSLYKVAYPSGVTHFIEKLAFNSTERFKREDIACILERYGGVCDCQATKDTIIYAASCHISGVDKMMELISDTILRPLITDEEFVVAKEVVRSNVDAIHMKPEPEELLTDLIHAAAYRDNTLGLSKICPKENVEKIRRDLLFSYLKTHTPNRIVVAGVGVPHDVLVNTSRKNFDPSSAIWERNPSLVSSNLAPRDESIAQYTGGIMKVEKYLSNVSQGINDFSELAHFVLGLESCGYKDPDFVAFCVLNSLMGGGGSFSSGGPGKGMYTRLYLDVLNKYHWMYNATSFNAAYADSGLFYIHASANPSQLFDLVTVILHQFLQMAADVGRAELQRAKAHLSSHLMMKEKSTPRLVKIFGKRSKKPTIFTGGLLYKMASMRLAEICNVQLENVRHFSDSTMPPPGQTKQASGHNEWQTEKIELQKKIIDLQDAMQKKDIDFQKKFDDLQEKLEKEQAERKVLEPIFKLDNLFKVPIGSRDAWKIRKIG